MNTDTVTPAQTEYLIDLGADPATIAGYTKAEASKAIDKAKASRDMLDQVNHLDAQITGALHVDDYQVEIVERDTPLRATRATKRSGMVLTHEARIVCPDDSPRMNVMTSTVEIDGAVYWVQYIGQDYRGEGGEVHPIPRDSRLAWDITAALVEKQGR